MPALRWFACALLVFASGAVHAADIAVDLELVLAVDVSRSMDAEEQALQRNGYAAAITHPDVLAAIQDGPLGRIAVTYVAWSSPVGQQVIVPWTLIDGAESAAVFAARIAPAAFDGRFGTSISSSLVFSAGLFEGNGFSGERRTIDVSGDGPNNSGPPVAPARDAVVAEGIVVNGLPIMLRPSAGIGIYGIADLDVYYADCVIGGPGAFIVPVVGLEGFADAVRRKLVLEIAARPSLVLPAADRRVLGASDCLIGEKLRRNWMNDR
ncbi:DUF1194 domain-containing protein [Prosthecomicrobium pneumaticum]|uniref:VWFA domain-containing protein n=1 Tax=Prosthecomicrobium pneumaticum TaxID=81895 RepID=A0A7W9CW16_9HYPH|nr:DUF1194 domain-containing protein [Prosthecomicrobium pneumaticum]MBB5752658.1 hypothetical protein [Prosthecomicrobium pneumaticum]